MKNTVLILGAGASMDYDYPLWKDLRKQMLDLEPDIGDFLATEVGLDETEIAAHKEAYEEFCSFARSDTKDTLDQIIYKIDKHKDKHEEPTGHLIINIAGLLLAKVELEKKDGGWVTKFQNVLIEHLVTNCDSNKPDQNLLSNLTVVSLNYDRVFEHFISHDFYKKMRSHASYDLPHVTPATTFSRSNQLNIFKPHGYICQLASQNNASRVGMNPDLVLIGTTTQGTRHPDNDMPVAYGAPQIAEKDTFLRMGHHMYVVDERGANDYRTPNEFLSKAEIVFCLGLSDAGISQSSFNFENVEQIYLSNKEADIVEIEKQKPGPKYVPLNVTGARLDASDFPDQFKKICL
jgi:hypothetical protein